MTTDRVLAGRYRLVEPIARGGMAEVWEAHDEVLARPVAVKVLHAHLARDPGFAERFRREAVAAARLAHPNIVATYDAGTDGDTAYIVMELVKGRTLRQALEVDAALSSSTAARIAIDVADALDCAHRNGLVHRDVKPANILLAETPGSAQLRVKVADFGIAKLEAEAGGGDLTQTGAVIGTAKYLSPEQVEGRTPDARSDLYALGVVLYEMLCGRPPFAAETELATALQHVRGEPLAPRRLVAGIPRPLEAVVLRAMAKDPADRYQSAAELRAGLAAVDLADDDAVPLITRDPTPPGGIVPVARRARRAWVPLAVLGVVAVAAVVLAASLMGSGGRSPGSPDLPAPTAQPVRIASVKSFDPQGEDGVENDDLAHNAIDGDPSTDWHSDNYKGPNFGRLKDGVGLIFSVSGQAKLQELKAFSGVKGWSAAVYVADSPGRSLADWGQPVAHKEAIGGDATFDLGGRKGEAVLLWITDPGPANRAEITDVTLTGS
ncbi:MAG: eukaryotic-like serine/threonine-protein kinase [Acidimicrobiaceae bacterium]|nr:eukaryotic-like serine/threonine-protein kinase [Acidimicrobiaceae bacterium]